MSYGKFELDLRANSLMKHMVEFEIYIRLINDLVLINYEFFAKCFEINISQEKDNVCNIYLIITNHVLNLFIFNKKMLIEKLKKVYVPMITEVKSKDYTTISTWNLIKKFKKGKEEGVYKSVESFKKVLDKHLISVDNFKYILQVQAGVERGFDRKITMDLGRQGG